MDIVADCITKLNSNFSPVCFIFSKLPAIPCCEAHTAMIRYIQHKQGESMGALFIFCAGIIPLVPLIGAEIFSRRKDKIRRNVCIGLFALQLMLSFAYVRIWFI